MTCFTVRTRLQAASNPAAAFPDGGGFRVVDRGDEPYIFHFPDGNASIARLLVRSLVPAALPGKTMEDVVTARLDYSRIDRPDQQVRIRLNSTAVETAHTADASAVDVTYVHHGEAHTVRAKKCILACYNSAIPWICPELPEEQKRGLAHNVKVPLTYTKVLVPNWRAFAELAFATSTTRTTSTNSDQALSGAGFDAGRDIHAITVNRWAHGYSYSPGRTWEPEYAAEADKPWVKGRQPFGRISIANSDAGAAANTNSAITQAHRAVAEALAT